MFSRRCLPSSTQSARLWADASPRTAIRSPRHSARTRAPFACGNKNCVASEGVSGSLLGWAAWSLHRSRCGYESRRVYHTIHFGFVAWLTVATAGENIERRGGWLLTSLVGAVFYVASFATLKGAQLRRPIAWLRATTIWLM